jgi:hypothetical protein
LTSRTMASTSFASAGRNGSGAILAIVTSVVRSREKRLTAESVDPAVEDAVCD